MAWTKMPSFRQTSDHGMVMYFFSHVHPIILPFPTFHDPIQSHYFTNNTQLHLLILTLSIDTKTRNMSFKNDYSRVSDDELSSEPSSHLTKSRNVKEHFLTVYFWLIHGILAATYLVVVMKYFQAPNAILHEGFFSKMKNDIF